MLKNYFLIAIRNLLNQKINSLINILGLAIGLACFIMILLWVDHEMSYDVFHENYENIYQVYEQRTYTSNEKFFTFATPAPLAPYLNDKYPDIELAGRFKFMGGPIAFKFEEKIFNETKIAFADKNFFEIFSFPVVSGTVDLSKKNEVVLC